MRSSCSRSASNPDPHSCIRVRALSFRILSSAPLVAAIDSGPGARANDPASVWRRQEVWPAEGIPCIDNPTTAALSTIVPRSVYSEHTSDRVCRRQSCAPTSDVHVQPSDSPGHCTPRRALSFTSVWSLRARPSPSSFRQCRAYCAFAPGVHDRASARIALVFQRTCVSHKDELFAPLVSFALTPSQSRTTSTPTLADPSRSTEFLSATSGIAHARRVARRATRGLSSRLDPRRPK